MVLRTKRISSWYVPHMMRWKICRWSNVDRCWHGQGRPKAVFTALVAPMWSATDSCCLAFVLCFQTKLKRPTCPRLLDAVLAEYPDFCPSEVSIDFEKCGSPLMDSCCLLMLCFQTKLKQPKCETVRRSFSNYPDFCPSEVD